MKSSHFWRAIGKTAVVCLALTFTVGGVLAADAKKPLYQIDFEKEDVGQEPLDFLILDGAFTVAQEQGNRVLILPGAPLESFGLLFGPTERDGVEVRARIFSSRKRRLFPSFGVGLNGVSGYRFLCSPNKAEIELKNGDEVKKAIPLKWKTDTWTQFRLQVVKVKDGQWKVRGKLWEQGTKEPEKWQIEIEETEEPLHGKAAIWGTPYSGKTIKYDDLKVVAVGGK